MAAPFECVGGRRFVLTCGCVLIATGLCWFDKLTGGEWVAAIVATAAAYIAGNTIQKATDNELGKHPD